MTLAVQDAGELTGDLDLETDVVVVGSGTGGAVAATELAKAGLRVVILEEGRHIPDLGKLRRSEVLRHVWRDAGMTVALGLGNTPTISVMTGRGVGGSSLLTGGVCFRTPERVLDRWVRDEGLVGYSARDMEPYFDAVESVIHVEDVPRSMRTRSTIKFDEGATKLGFPLKPLRRNTKNCRGCGRCNFVCPEGAKTSVDISYLPRAVAAGAQIFSHCLVERVETSGDRAIGVTGKILAGIETPTGRKLNVRAKRIILACGALHTPLLLRQSGIGRRNRQIGRNLTLHPGVRVFARFKERLDGWVGALQSAYSDAFEQEGLTFLSLHVPPSVLAAAVGGVGPVHHERTEAVPYIAMFGGMIHDKGGGVVRRGLGREPIVTYRMSQRDRARVPRAIELMTETFLAAGATEIYLPILGHAPVRPDTLKTLDLYHIHGRKFECASQHPLGSCRMGVSPKTSVVNREGQVWGLRSLYIVDGSIVPTSLGVNPQVSIMALATRVAWGLRDAPQPN